MNRPIRRYHSHVGKCHHRLEFHHHRRQHQRCHRCCLRLCLAIRLNQGRTSHLNLPIRHRHRQCRHCYQFRHHRCQCSHSHPVGVNRNHPVFHHRRHRYLL